MSKILLVEDNKLSQKMMFYTLKKMGIEADFAEDGQQAVDMACATNYSVILMDIMMPLLDGYEATKIIREGEAKSGHRAFIIGLTSNVFDSERDRCIEAGMDEYMSKPFDADIFYEILNKKNYPLFD